MQRLVVLFLLCALSAGQVLRAPSSYNNGVKWAFGSDVSAHSNYDQGPISLVYKKELIAPITEVYKNPFETDFYKKLVVPTAYKKDFVLQNVRQHQSVIPPVFKVHSAYSDIYKSEPIVQNVYKQQAAVPIVHKTYPAGSNIYQFKSHPIQPVVSLQESSLFQDFVPKVPAVNSLKKLQPYWNYQYNPHHTFVHGGVVPHN